MPAETDKANIITNMMTQPSEQHFLDAFGLLLIIRTAKDANIEEPLRSGLETIDKDTGVFPMLVEAGFIRKTRIDETDPVRDFTITWKGLQFFETFRYYQKSKLDGDTAVTQHLRWQLLQFF